MHTATGSGYGATMIYHPSATVNGGYSVGANSGNNLPWNWPI